MNVFDLIVLAILAVLTLRGIWKGMISQIVSVASFFVCWIVATRFGGLIAPTIPVEAPWNQVLAMGIIFLITLIAIRFAYTALEKLIKHWHLDKFNKLLGGVLGFIKGLLLCLIITFFAVMFSESTRSTVFNSKSGNHFVQLITRISLFVPKDSYEFVHTQFDQFQNKVDGVVPGQTSEILRIQDTEKLQQALGKLQQTKAKAENSSLWTALSNWWSGTAPEKEQGGASPPVLEETATTYVPPAVSPYVNAPQIAVPQPPVAVEEFFVQRAASPQAATTSSLTALTPTISEISPPSHSTLAPLTELLPTQLEPIQLLPTLPTQHHVGSDQLLRNSGQSARSDAPARVFRPR